MPDLIFMTGNSGKFEVAHNVFAEHGIVLRQASADIDEIQSEDTERIVRDKASKAFAAVGKPVIINDDSWSFTGLGGFPGPYMKSIVHWFKADDFIRLMQDVTDRRVILTQWIAYQDATVQKLFKLQFEGRMLTEVRGNYGLSLHKVVTMPGDDGLSIAEAYDRGVDLSAREVAQGWRNFISWYKEYLS